MSRTGSGILLQHLRHWATEPIAARTPDNELLRRFVDRRDQAAFATLVRRHGPMVMRVCRRILRNEHDAEDVCQAVFLVLASKASSQHWQASLAGWLSSA
jgi:DNA-directed RNA polymerase specialized sigma24 family protein